MEMRKEKKMLKKKKYMIEVKGIKLSVAQSSGEKDWVLGKLWKRKKNIYEKRLRDSDQNGAQKRWEKKLTVELKKKKSSVAKTKRGEKRLTDRKMMK